MTDEVEQYKRLCGMLWQALEFYANPDTYVAISILADPSCGEFIDDGTEIDGRWRPGKIARDTIAEAIKLYPDLTITLDE